MISKKFVVEDHESNNLLVEEEHEFQSVKGEDSVKVISRKL